MENKTRLLVTRESDLPDIARQILEKHAGQRLFAFYGEMGSGKTTLIKEICKQLGVQGQTSSPTFAIIHEYFTKQGESIYHFDFYRIEKSEELAAIGVGEYLESGCYGFLEWPENARDILPEGVVSIQIEQQDNENQRIIIF